MLLSPFQSNVYRNKKVNLMAIRNYPHQKIYIVYLLCYLLTTKGVFHTFAHSEIVHMLKRTLENACTNFSFCYWKPSASAEGFVKHYLENLHEYGFLISCWEWDAHSTDVSAVSLEV